MFLGCVLYLRFTQLQRYRCSLQLISTIKIVSGFIQRSIQKGVAKSGSKCQIVAARIDRLQHFLINRMRIIDVLKVLRGREFSSANEKEIFKSSNFR